MLFLGELGDKTQIMVFNLSLEHDKSYKVAIGSILGFITIVTLGIVLGSIINQFIPIKLISIISGIVFILIGVLETRTLKELYQEQKQLPEDKHIKMGDKADVIDKDEDSADNKTKFANLRKNPYLAGFSFIFVMEMGDKSQLLTITLASIYPNSFEVWLGAILALSSLTLMGAYFGEIIAQKIPKFYLKIITIVIFIVIGILVLISSFS